MKLSKDITLFVGWLSGALADRHRRDFVWQAWPHQVQDTEPHAIDLHPHQRERNMSIKPLEAQRSRSDRRMLALLSHIHRVLLLCVVTGFAASYAGAAAPPDACIDGYVWREAYPDDHVCVALATREQAAADNKLATTRREPQGGAYGADTCKPGFVWRDARPNDYVCVTPEVRAQTARDNSLAHTRQQQPSVIIRDNEPQLREQVPRQAQIWSRENSHAKRSKRAPMAVPEISKPAPDSTAAPTPAPAPAPQASAIRSYSFRLPEFPWPPPPFSTRLKLDRALLVAGQTTPTNGSVAARMEQALAANGYTQLSYYAVPDGFTIATRIERIAPNAASAAEQRWSTQIPAVSLIPFNLDAYIKALLGKNGDTFRVIVFTFTPTPFTTSSKVVAPGEAMAWAEKGATALPAALAAQAYGSDTICTALVYEFRISSLGAALQRPSAFDGRKHLRAAGILKALEPQP